MNILQNANTITRRCLDIFAQESDMLDRNDLSTVLNAVNSPTNLQAPRRHSSTAFSRNSLKQPQVKALIEMQRNFLNAMIAASTLEPLPEENSRGRALSEGTPALSIDSLGPDQQGQTSTNRYKTELCRPFEENGKCKYGEKCQFAHGKHELRHMVRHPKYKTELCRTYHTTGLCPYGPRCHFIHNQNEATLENQRIAASINARQGKPANLQLASQFSTSGRLNSYSSSPPQINSPLEAQTSFFNGSDFGPLSPPSPMIKPSGYFNNLKVPFSPFDEQSNSVYDFQINGGLDNRQGSPPLFPELSAYEYNVFESLTPSESDRESSTGSPPGFGPVQVAPSNGCQQRLPIFRCLSQS